MSWYTLEDDDDLDADAIARALAVKRMAARMLDMARSGRWHPERTAAMSEQLGLEVEGLEDDAVWTPAQRAWLRAFGRRLRRYARVVGRQHDHGPGTRLGRLRLKERPAGKRPVRAPRMTALPVSGWELDDDDELGFLPALPAILGAAAPLLGGLFGGDKKAAPAPAAPAAAAPPVIVSGGGGGASSDLNLPAIGGVVADQIRAVPPPVRQQVVDGVRELMDRQKAGQMDVAAMMKQIADLMGPKLQAQLASVNNAALQRQATYEHESLKRRDERWKNNAEAQRRILARLDQMESKLGTALQAKQRRLDATARAFGIPPRYQG